MLIFRLDKRNSVDIVEVCMRTKFQAHVKIMFLQLITFFVSKVDHFWVTTSQKLISGWALIRHWRVNVYLVLEIDKPD